MDRILGANTIDLGGGRRGFRGKDTVAGIPGTELAATWHNAIQEEIVGPIVLAGEEPSNADTLQLLKAFRSGVFNWRIPGGTPDALTIDLTPNLDAYVAGLPLRLVTGAGPNTGAMTIDVDGLGPKALQRRGGGAMAAGDLPANSLIEAVYDGAAFRVAGFVRSDYSLTFASNAEIAAGVVTGKPIDPAGLFSLAKSLGANGYQMLPGGLYIQWGKVDPAAGTALTTVAFPIAFPTDAYAVILTDIAANVGNADQLAVRSTGLSASGFTIVNDEQGTAVFWLALGK